MRLLLLALLLSAGTGYCQERTEKRLTTLEKRVTRVEGRVARLEGGSPAAAAQKAEPAEPVGVVFLEKKQVAGKKRLGIRLYMEFENLSSRRFSAFNGTLVFRDEKGDVIWEKPYGHTEPLGAGEKVEVSLGLLSDQAKPYLKFVKARKITVELEKQEAYAFE